MTTVYLGTRCTVMLNSYDTIKEAFVRYGDVFAGRPQDLFFFRELLKGKGDFVKVVLETDPLRVTLMPCLLQPAILTKPKLQFGAGAH